MCKAKPNNASSCWSVSFFLQRLWQRRQHYMLLELFRKLCPIGIYSYLHPAVKPHAGNGVSVDAIIFAQLSLFFKGELIDEREDELLSLGTVAMMYYALLKCRNCLKYQGIVNDEILLNCPYSWVQSGRRNYYPNPNFVRTWLVYVQFCRLCYYENRRHYNSKLLAT